MTEDLRWAARYAFVEDLWRGRPRVIVDPHLQSALRQGPESVAHGLDPAVRHLVEDLLPHRRDEDGHEPVWMGVDTPQDAAELGRARPGTQFVPRDALAEVMRRARWEVALLDLGAWLLDSHAAEDDDAEQSLAEIAAAWIDELGLPDHPERTVVLVLPVRDYPRAPAGLDYAEVAELVAERLGGGRVFGVYRPPMTAIVDFGERIDPSSNEGADEEEVEDDEVESDEVEGDVDEAQTLQIDLQTADEDGARAGVLEVPDDLLDDEDVPLIFDNTLGSQEPLMLDFLAVCGGPEATESLPEGLSLVELPAQASAESTGESGVRSQLTQARRRADTAVIERQRQVERADALERENAALRREVSELQDAMARTVTASLAGPHEQTDGGSGPMPSSPTSSGDEDAESNLELAAALAREQALRWRVSQLESELGRALARPVEQLEAELARLEAQLQRMGSSAGIAEPPASTAKLAPATPQVERDSRRSNGVEAGPHLLHDPEGPHRSRLAVITAMDGLLRRIERGGIGTLQLRGELLALKRRLRR